jgi:hypothetical protein
VSERPDPERLLAEALRAQASRAPLPEPVSMTPPVPTTPISSAGPADAAGLAGATGGAATAGQNPTPPTDRLLGLLSGADHEHGLLSGRAPEATGPAGRTDPVPRPSERTRVGETGPLTTTGLRSAPGRLSVWWILLLAALLGLAAGTIVGLVTLF